jgi:hypothetical protein
MARLSTAPRISEGIVAATETFLAIGLVDLVPAHLGGPTVQVALESG